MDGTAAVMQYVNLVLFVGLGLVCVQIARRRRTAPALWAAVSFGVLGVVVIAGNAVPDEPEGAAVVLTKLLILGIAAYPYALHRFARSFEPLPRRGDLVVTAVTGALVIATIALPRIPDEDQSRPWWFQAYVLVFISYWCALGVLVARRLWAAGRSLPRVARYRMRTLALGAIGLALALVPSVFGEEQPVALRVLGLALPPLSAVLFFVGLVPPPWLRAMWRRPDQAALRRVELDLIRADSRDRVFAEVLPYAAALVGGSTATFTEQDVTEGAERRDGADVIRLPVATGHLVVEMAPYAPFFGDDEVDALRSLAAFVDLVLERAVLLEREREARTEAERTSAELETLVYGISHDLKSPVISVLGYLEYLREDYGKLLGDEGNHFVDRMERSATYMQELLSDLLELSRVGRVALDAEDVDLSALIADVRVDVNAKFPEAVIEVGALPTVHMNASRARQLFTNLIENAARHGGRPDIVVRVSGEVLADGGAVVSVADDGVGVPAEYREKAFGIFERLAPRDAASGTGIGLALCRKIVETTGGSIQMVEAPVGTRVRIDFPASAVRSGRASSSEVPSWQQSAF